MKVKLALFRRSAFVRCLMVLAVSVGVGCFAASARGEPVVPVSSGVSLTIFEQTGKILETTFPVSTLMTDGGEFLTAAYEKYTVTSDGTYLTIRCLHDRTVVQAEMDQETIPDHSVLSQLPFGDLPGHQVGNNIVAVRLDGVPDFPAGLWASFIVDYTLGERGIPESRFNALGNALIRGPYGDRHYTVLGVGYSEITLGFSPLIEASIVAEELQPWDDAITLDIKLPEGHSVADISFYSLEVAEIGDAEVKILPLAWWSIGDHNGDGSLSLQAQFSLWEFNNYLLPGDNLFLVRGTLSSGIAFQGRAIVSIK